MEILTLSLSYFQAGRQRRHLGREGSSGDGSHRQKRTLVTSPKRHIAKKIWVVTSPKNNFPYTSTCHIAKKVGLSHCQKKNFSSVITQVKEGFKRNKKLWKLSICKKEGSKRPTWTKGCVKRLGFQNLYPSLFHSHRCSSRGSDYKDPPSLPIPL